VAALTLARVSKVHEGRREKKGLSGRTRCAYILKWLVERGRTPSAENSPNGKLWPTHLARKREGDSLPAYPSPLSSSHSSGEERGEKSLLELKARTWRTAISLAAHFSPSLATADRVTRSNGSGEPAHFHPPSPSPTPYLRKPERGRKKAEMRFPPPLSVPNERQRGDGAFSPLSLSSSSTLYRLNMEGGSHPPHPLLLFPR